MSIRRLTVLNSFHDILDISTVAASVFFSIFCIFTVVTPAAAAINSEKDGFVPHGDINETEIVRIALVLGFANGVFRQLQGLSKEKRD